MSRPTPRILVAALLGCCSTMPLPHVAGATGLVAASDVADAARSAHHLVLSDSEGGLVRIPVRFEPGFVLAADPNIIHNDKAQGHDLTQLIRNALEALRGTKPPAGGKDR